MASSSSDASAGPDRRVAPLFAASGTGVMHADDLYEVLLRVPAKALCRMRLVSREWRRLLSDPRFAAEHAARHREPLFIAGFFHPKQDRLCDIVDLSGQTVKQVRGKKGDTGSVPYELLSVVTHELADQRLLDPATGVVYVLPQGLAEENATRGLNRSDYSDERYLFGQVASRRGTNEYKVLRILSDSDSEDESETLFEVCTVGSNARWRGKPAPPESFVWKCYNSVVIDGVVYLSSWDLDRCFGEVSNQVIEHNWIIMFDLEKEELRPKIQGPPGLDDVGSTVRHQLTLANLNGSLGVVLGPDTYRDIWILMDFEKGLWVKQYTIQVERHENVRFVLPLFVLGDGRIVVHMDNTGLLKMYDPRTNTYTNLVEKDDCFSMSFYSGNLLSLEQ